MFGKLFFKMLKLCWVKFYLSLCYVICFFGLGLIEFEIFGYFEEIVEFVFLLDKFKKFYKDVNMVKNLILNRVIFC